MKKLMIIFSLEDITLFSAIKEIIQCLFEKNVTKDERTVEKEGMRKQRKTKVKNGWKYF